MIIHNILYPYICIYNIIYIYIHTIYIYIYIYISYKTSKSLNLSLKFDSFFKYESMSTQTQKGDRPVPRSGYLISYFKRFSSLHALLTIIHLFMLSTSSKGRSSSDCQVCRQARRPCAAIPALVTSQGAGGC